MLIGLENAAIYGSPQTDAQVDQQSNQIQQIVIRLSAGSLPTDDFFLFIELLGLLFLLNHMRNLNRGGPVLQPEQPVNQILREENKEGRRPNENGGFDWFSFIPGSDLQIISNRQCH